MSDISSEPGRGLGRRQFLHCALRTAAASRVVPTIVTMQPARAAEPHQPTSPRRGDGGTHSDGTTTDGGSTDGPGTTGGGTDGGGSTTGGGTTDGDGGTGGGGCDGGGSTGRSGTTDGGTGAPMALTWAASPSPLIPLIPPWAARRWPGGSSLRRAPTSGARRRRAGGKPLAVPRCCSGAPTPAVGSSADGRRPPPIRPGRIIVGLSPMPTFWLVCARPRQATGTPGPPAQGPRATLWGRRKAARTANRPDRRAGHSE